MKRNILLAIATAAITITAATTAFAVDEAKLAAAQKEGEVVVYTSQSTITMEGMTKMFEAQFPGIKMKVLRAQGASILERLLAERDANRQVADVFISWWDTASQVPAKGYAAKYLPPDIDGFPKDFIDPESRWMAVAAYVNVIGYNTNTLKGDAIPKSYKDLVDPRFQGKISLGDPRVGGGPYYYYYAMWKAHGPAYFTDLGKNKPYIATSDVTVNSVSSGQIDIGVAGEAGWLEAAKAGAPVAYVYPEEGVNVSYWFESILDNAPHPNAARLFVDWLVSEDGQKAIATAPRGIIPLRPGVPGPKGMKPLSELKVAPVALDEFMPKQAEIIKTVSTAFGFQSAN